MKKFVRSGGFTLIELLLVIAIIAILAAIVIIAINPARQLAQSRNAQRKADVNTIINGVWQYAVDNDGTMPGPIPVDDTSPILCGDPDGIDDVSQEICSSDEGADCTGLLDLNADLVEDYLAAIPEDPQDDDANGTRYFIVQSDNGRVTVCAPDAELEETIQVKR